jgi:hypothetical protein
MQLVNMAQAIQYCLDPAIKGAYFQFHGATCTVVRASHACEYGYLAKNEESDCFCEASLRYCFWADNDQS